MNWLILVQVIIAVSLMIVILLQNRGTGVSGIFGGSGNVYRTKRGVEKSLFTLTIFFAFLFFAISIFNVIV